jgi:2-polyprenyl-3-methyl-5-hydroxy-6-metoxy-1,4-benzoquinol methylase
VFISRTLKWGFEYLAIKTFCINKIASLIGQDDTRKSILDLGCGDGSYLIAMSNDKRFSGVKLTGIDLSEKAINLAKGFEPQLDFRVADISSVIEQYDFILCNQVLENVADDETPQVLKKAETFTLF